MEIVSEKNLALLNDLIDFDIPNAELSLWIYRKPYSPANTAPKFKGRWVETTVELDQALKNTVIANRETISELIEFGLLAQNNEASALTISSDETHAHLMLDEQAGEEDDKRARRVEDIQNTIFYVIKMVSNDKVLYAARKADASWKTKKASFTIQAFFSSDEELDLSNNRGFEIHKTVDFFIFEETVFVKHKGNFESILNYKEAHKNDYNELAAEPEFIEVFDDLSIMTQFVGENKIHLRRLSAIRQKGHYKDGNFMERLKARYAEYGLNIEFDDNGKITPTPETCRDIIAALLDHRLVSGFSENIYDVPDATVVNV